MSFLINMLNNYNPFILIIVLCFLNNNNSSIFSTFFKNNIDLIHT